MHRMLPLQHIMVDGSRTHLVCVHFCDAVICCKQLLATFDNGRLEAFLDMRTLTSVELTEPAMALRIARRLRQFHRCKVSLPGVDPAHSELFATMWRSYVPHPGSAVYRACCALCACRSAGLQLLAC